VITGYGPDIDVAAAGFTVVAFVTLEIAQGALDRVKSDLAAIPAVLEAYAVTGSADMICKVAATSHADLQQTLLRIDSSPSVARSTSAIALSTVIAPRDLPLLTSRAPATTPRSPAFRLPRSPGQTPRLTPLPRARLLDLPRSPGPAGGDGASRGRRGLRGRPGAAWARRPRPSSPTYTSTPTLSLGNAGVLPVCLG
jgi:hypothetical protein